jgi:hypothetical protein
LQNAQNAQNAQVEQNAQNAQNAQVEGAKLPDRCPSRKCRSLRWNLTLMGQVVEKARKVGAVAVQINETVIPTSRCENPKHEGFQRKDGYWCITCVRLYG